MLPCWIIFKYINNSDGYDASHDVDSRIRSGYYGNLGSLKAGTRHHGDYSVYGNSFPPTFPEDLLAHASQMTGQLSRSMQIWRAREAV